MNHKQQKPAATLFSMGPKFQTCSFSVDFSFWQLKENIDFVPTDWDLARTQSENTEITAAV